MSNLLDFDDDDDFFGKGEKSSTTTKDLDEIFGTSKQSESDNLDDIFGMDTSKKKPLSDKQIEDLFGKGDDDEFDFFAKGGGDAEKVKDENQIAAKPPAGFDDSFAMLVQTNADQPGTPKMSHDQSDVKTPDLDFLLQAQPAGMLDSTDDLLMFDPFTELPKKANSSPSLNPKVKKSTELKIDPTDDFFADAPLSPRLIEPEPSQPEPSQPPFVKEIKMESGDHEQGTGNLKKKRSVERSFEDLLHGLSEESDPDLDDMITHDTEYSANLESILPSPDKGHTSEDTEKDFSTPGKHLDPSITMDIMTSTPKAANLEHFDIKETPSGEDEQEIPELRVETPEGIVKDPDSDLEEQDLKGWEMIDKEDVVDDDDDEVYERDNADNNDANDDDDDDDDVGEEEDGDMNNSGLEDVIMRRRKNRNKKAVNGLQTKESIDLSAIEDSNKLDVDINKHKSEVTKRGSLALRRKPSRKNRRSLISTEEDSIYKDSTRPRTMSLPNGDGDMFDRRDSDLSPPPKKPSPGFMMPLPGMASRPPAQRLSTGSPDEDTEMVAAPRRTSKPPPGAFKLPTVAPRVRPPPDGSSKEDLVSKHLNKIRSEPHPLRSVPASCDLTGRGSEERDMTFETPKLKSVSRGDKSKPDGEENDTTFEKPKLRSTPKPDSSKRDKTNEGSGSYVKPSLRSTPKHEYNARDTSKEERIGSHSSEIETPVLRHTPKSTSHDKKSDFDKYSSNKQDEKLDFNKHSFDKPDLRRGGRGLDSERKDSDSSSRTYSFDKPKHTGDIRTEKSAKETNEKSHTFEKPALRNTPAKVQMEKKEDSESGYTFSKPTLRKSPEKQTKDSQNENKGYFDKPSLRKTENKHNKENSHISSSGKDYSSNFPEMKLRKIERPPTEGKEKTSDKPAWLQEAKSKQSKVLDAIHHQEVFKRHYLYGETVPTTYPFLLEHSPAIWSSSHVPLQETSQNQTGSVTCGLKENQSSQNEARSRVSSVGFTEGDSNKGKDRKLDNCNGTNEKSSPAWLEKPLLRKSPHQVPLQETSPNQTDLVSSDLKQTGIVSSDITDSQFSQRESRSRGSSVGSADGESKGRDRKPAKDNNYTPSWMRQGRSPSTPGFIPLTPAKSCSSIDEVDKVPQWKKDLMQRRQNRKNSLSDTPKKEESPEPEWKTNQLRKLRPTPGPVKEVTPTEPEWKKAAEEKKARLRSKSLQYSHLKVGL